MLLWQGACIVHEEFKGAELAGHARRAPRGEAYIVHPESPASVSSTQADYVGSTSGLIDDVRTATTHETFIVATDKGIFYKMREAAPEKTLIEAPTAGRSATCRSCAACPWMAMNGLRKLRDALRDGTNTVDVDAEIGERAYRPIKRLLDFSAARHQTVLGNNDA